VRAVVCDCAALRQCAAECGSARGCVRQCVAVCGTAHGSVRAVRAVRVVRAVRSAVSAVRLDVYGSAVVCVRQCGSVRRCVAVPGVVCSSARGSVRQCVVVCSSAHGSVWQCTVHTCTHVCKVAHNIFIGMPLYKEQWDSASYSLHINTNISVHLNAN
jgi:hypothetical protein